MSTKAERRAKKRASHERRIVRRMTRRRVIERMAKAHARYFLRLDAAIANVIPLMVANGKAMGSAFEAFAGEVEP